MTASPRAFRNARRLRREMSLPEILLWQRLRQRPGGFKFRRQHPIGDFDLDFYVTGIKLAVEIDGIVHDMGDRPEHDALRTAWLESLAFKVIRINAKDVLTDPDAVADSLVRVCTGMR